MRIKDNLRSKISLLKEEKKRLVVEEKLVDSRLSQVIWDVNFNSKIQTNKFFNGLFEEIKYFNSLGINQGVLKENLINALNGIMGDESSNINSGLKMKLIDFLNSKFNMIGFEKTVLTQAIMETDDSEISNLFVDSKFLAKKISDIFVDAFENEYLSDLTDTTREIIMSQFDLNKFKRNIEDRYSEVLDALMGSVRSNMDRKLSDIRNNVFS